MFSIQIFYPSNELSLLELYFHIHPVETIPNYLQSEGYSRRCMLCHQQDVQSEAAGVRGSCIRKQIVSVDTIGEASMFACPCSPALLMTCSVEPGCF